MWPGRQNGNPGYIENSLEVAGLDLRGRADREPRAILFSKEGLANGPHTIRIVVPATKSGVSAGSGFVALDACKVLDGKTKGEVQFIICNEWNYPEGGWRIWGDHVKDAIAVGTAYKNTIRIRFRDRDDKR